VRVTRTQKGGQKGWSKKTRSKNRTKKGDQGRGKGPIKRREGYKKTKLDRTGSAGKQQATKNELGRLKHKGERTQKGVVRRWGTTT